MTPATTTRRSRPWLVSCAGGKVLATFHYPERAHERAGELLGLGVVSTVWVHNRWTGEYVLRRAS